MHKTKTIILLIFGLASTVALAAGKTDYSPVTFLQPVPNGTYISNCPITTTADYEQITACIKTSECGTGKLFFLPITDNANYSAYLSIALTSSTAKIPIRIVGNGICSSGYEEVNHIVFSNQ